MQSRIIVGKMWILLVTIFVGFISEELCQGFQKREYHMHLEKMAYENAKLYCKQEYNGHLLDLRPLLADSLVNQLQGYVDRGDITGTDYFWTGLTHPVDTVVWFDGEIFDKDTTRFPLPYISNIKPGRCISLKWSTQNTLWLVKARDCTQNNGFICDHTIEGECGYCQRPDTDFSTAEMSKSSRTEASVLSCESLCGDECWFYEYKTGEQTCSLYNSTLMPATLDSKLWFGQATGSDLYEKKCFNFHIHHANGKVVDNQPCPIYSRPIEPEEEMTTWIGAETTNILHLVTTWIVAESTVATSRWSETDMRDTTVRRLEPTSKPAIMTSDMHNRLISATNILEVTPPLSLFDNVLSVNSDMSVKSDEYSTEWMSSPLNTDFSQLPVPGTSAEFMSVDMLDSSINDFRTTVVSSGSDISSTVGYSGSDVSSAVLYSGSDVSPTVDYSGSDVSSTVDKSGSDVSSTVDYNGSDVNADVLDSLRTDFSVLLLPSISDAFSNSWIPDSLRHDMSTTQISSNIKEFDTAWMLSSLNSAFLAKPALSITDELDSAGKSFSSHDEVLETSMPINSVFDTIGSTLTSYFFTTDFRSPSTSDETSLQPYRVDSIAVGSLFASSPSRPTPLTDVSSPITPTYISATTANQPTRSVFPVFTVPINCSAVCPCLRMYTGIREDLLRNITIDFKNLSSYKRLYNSYEDERISVKILGYTGVTCIVCFVLFVLLLDSSALWRAKELIQIRAN